MKRNEAINPWKKLSGEVKYENPWIKITEDKVKNPAGNDGIYGVVHFKQIAVAIIPLDKENNTWIVGQYRYRSTVMNGKYPRAVVRREHRPLKLPSGNCAKKPACTPKVMR